MMQSFGDTLGQVAMLFGDLVKAFLPVAPIAFEILGALAEGLRTLAPFLGEVARVLAGGLLAGFQALQPAMAPLGEALVALAAPVAELAGQLGQVLAAALIALVPVITELAPPLTELISLAGTALVGAISVLAPVLAELAPLVGNVLTGLIGAFTQALKSVLPYLDDIATVIGSAVVDAVQMLLPMMPQLTEAWLTVVRAVLPLIPAMAQLTEALLPALLGLIPVLAPVLLDMATAFADIMPALVPVITALVEGLVPVIAALTPLIIDMAKIFTASFDLMFTGMIVPLLQFVVIPILRILADTLTWLWRTIAVPAIEGIGAIVSWVWENVLRPGFDSIKTAVDTVGRAFESAVTFIGEAWGKLRELSAKPINFVIETVYNNGLRLLWNKIADFVGLDPLPPIDPIKFAGGGVLPGYAPGVDVVPSLLSPGEAVLVPELVRMLGPANILAANAAASGGRPATIAGFSSGRVARFAGGGVVDTVLGFVQGLGEDVIAMVRDPIGWIKAHIGIPDSPWINMVAKTPGKLIGDSMTWLGDRLTSFFGFGDDEAAAAVASAGGAGVAGGRPAGWQQMWSVISGVFPSATLNSSFRPGDPGYHGKGRAIDIGGPMGAINSWIAQVYPNSTQLIYTPGKNILNGQPFTYDAPTRADHYDHVHWAFDQGGWLPPGVSSVYNGTGQPEPVFTDRQWNTLASSSGSGSGRITGELAISGDGLTAYVDGRIQHYDQDSADALLRGTRI
jgi:hypothetical protein